MAGKTLALRWTLYFIPLVASNILSGGGIKWLWGFWGGYLCCTAIHSNLYLRLIKDPSCPSLSRQKNRPLP